MNIIFMRAACGVVVASLSATAASASYSASGYISQIYVTENGAIVFNQDGQRNTLPGCQATGFDQRWSFDGTTPAGQAKLSMPLTAHAQHERVQINGNGACVAWPDAETLTYIVTDD